MKFDEYEKMRLISVILNYLLYMRYLFISYNFSYFFVFLYIFFLLITCHNSSNTSKSFSRLTGIFAAGYHQRQLLNVLEIHSSLCRFSSHFILFFMFLCRNVSKIHIHKYSRHIDREIKKNKNKKRKPRRSEREGGKIFERKNMLFPVNDHQNKKKWIKRRRKAQNKKK